MLMTKETILNEKTYSAKNFFQELLEKALEYEVIEEKEYIAYRDGMAKTVLEHAYNVTSEVESNISETIKVVVKNHLYIVSLYLFHNFKPSEALAKVKEISCFKLHVESVKYYQNTISNKFMELKKFEVKVNTSKEPGIIKNAYNNLIKSFNKALAYDINIWDITEGYLVESYPYMSSYDTDFVDIINNLQLVADSFMIEFSIRSKFNKDVINEIKKEYFLKNKKVLEASIDIEIRDKEAELRKRIKKDIENRYDYLERDDPNYSILFGSSEEEYKNEIENVLEELEYEKEERYRDIDSMFELDNMLVNTLVELACIVINIKYPNFKNPDTMSKKYKALRDVPKQILFGELFNHEEIITFDKKEKKYLEKYFLNNLVSVEE